MSDSASGSTSGLDVPAGLNGQLPSLLDLATFAAGSTADGAAAGLDPATGTGTSGTISATEGSWRSRPTSAADRLAATASGATSCVTSVPPLAVMSDTTGAWSDRAAAMRWLACVRRFMLENWYVKTTITRPPAAAPSITGAWGPVAAPSPAAAWARPPPDTASAVPSDSVVTMPSRRRRAEGNGRIKYASLLMF